MKYCFEELGYLRLEWKCNAFNEPSKAAARCRAGDAPQGRTRDMVSSTGGEDPSRPGVHLSNPERPLLTWAVQIVGCHKVVG